MYQFNVVFISGKFLRSFFINLPLGKSKIINGAARYAFIYLKM